MITANSSGITDRSASEKGSDLLEKGFEHLVQDQVVAAADVEFERQQASNGEVAGPGGHDVIASQPPRQHNSAIGLMTQTGSSNSFVASTRSMNGRGSQVYGEDDKGILHQQARKVNVVYVISLGHFNGAATKTSLNAAGPCCFKGSTDDGC